MGDSNSHVLEVLCSLKFDQHQNDWDSTYYGRYHDRLLPLGYTDKQEKKEVKLNLDMKSGSPQTNVQQGVTSFVFKNKTLNTAIMIGPHFVSFHKLAPYNTWNNLIKDVLEPCFTLYKEMGLGKGLVEVQCTYINSMQLDEGQRGVFDKFNILQPPTGAQESSINFQGNYELLPNTKALIRLNWNKIPQNGQKGIFFECSTFVKAETNSDYLKLAQQAHDSANLFYAQIKK